MIIPSSTHGVIASSRPRVVVASSIVTPTPALNWTGTLVCDDASPCIDYTEEQILGINQAITLTFTVTATSGTPPTVFYRKASTATSTAAGYCDSSNQYGGTPTPEGRHDGRGFTTLYDGATLVVSSLSVSSGDYLSFLSIANAPPFDGPHSVTIRINNQSDANAVLDTITFEQSGCYLTTTVVEYMGLADNGPELTAMRQLREYYIGVPGYSEIIQEYYQTSPAIITAINALADPSVEYTYIYNTVVAVMNHINGGEWQQAHDLYMAMYTDLKTRYLG
jgi:hypothetical protein